MLETVLYALFGAIFGTAFIRLVFLVEGIWNILRRWDNERLK